MLYPYETTIKRIVLLGVAERKCGDDFVGSSVSSKGERDRREPHLVTTASPEKDSIKLGSHKLFVLLASPTGFEPVLPP